VLPVCFALLEACIEALGASTAMVEGAEVDNELPMIGPQ
jgi:hypothetical protein